MSFSSAYWNPEVFEMPRTVFNSSSFDFLKDSLSISIKSVSSTSLIILGCVFSVALIVRVTLKLLNIDFAVMKGVNKRKFNRAVNALDFKRNENEIIDDKVRSMKVNFMAKQKFREQNEEDIINDKVKDMVINAEARKRYLDMNEGYYRMRKKG